MGKGSYGSIEFWDEYYVVDRPDPYDWFFSCIHLSPLLESLLIDKTQEILMVGCGNAPFSEQMFDLGYTQQVNCDNCALVIEQMKLRAPHMIWEVEDIREMKYESDRFGIVFDKGLLDNLYCYRDPEENCKKAINDMYRTLCPGGIFVVLSCHDEKEVRASLTEDPSWKWQEMMLVRLRNPRFPGTRVPFYSMIVAIKATDDGTTTHSLPDPHYFSELISPEDGEAICLNEEQAEAMKLKTEELNAQSRAEFIAKQNAVKQQHQAAADAYASHLETQAEAQAQVQQEPPNGSLAQQLTKRRTSLRRVSLEPLPPPTPEVTPTTSAVEVEIWD